MSNMLKEAIVDAKALRESALKSAENVVIEKYSNEVRKTLEHILEQDDLGMELGGDLSPDEIGAEPDAATDSPFAGDAGEPDFADPIAEDPAQPAEEVVENEDDLPFGATDGLSGAEGKNLDGFASAGEEVEVNIDLGALQEALRELNEELEADIDLEEATAAAPGMAGDEAVEDDADDDDAAAATAAGAAATEADSDATKDIPGLTEADDEKKKGKYDDGDGEDEKCDYVDCEDEGDVNEELDSDALVDAILEKLTVDLGAELSGWAGSPTSQLKHEQERELAGRQDDDVKEELEDLNKAQEGLVSENSQLKEQLDQYRQVVGELKENLQDVNLSNARLLYTNRVLRNTSLNERQKDKIVEAISSAGSVAEARTIFDTLQSTVESTPVRGPQSLGEAISRNRTSVIRATRKESTASDPFQDRMKRLAGIK